MPKCGCAAARLFFRPAKPRRLMPALTKISRATAAICNCERRTSTLKMKIKALSRSAASTQAPGSNVAKQTRNLDPNLHPFERAREYTRALNATKLERMFAQPFLASFEPGHVDGVYSFAKDPES
jgi:hypothetical protein